MSAAHEGNIVRERVELCRKLTAEILLVVDGMVESHEGGVMGKDVAWDIATKLERIALRHAASVLMINAGALE